MYQRTVKPLFDFFAALTAFLILLPLFIIISVLIKLDSPGPIFFRQQRLGKNGKVFSIYKFRSLINRPDNFMKGKPLQENDKKITKVGRFIRKTSLDELPQLINIMKGEMSFIGPRPPLTFYPKKYEEYSDKELLRFSVKPGLSGLAAVKQREVNDWDKNIPIDLEYVKGISFSLDLKLFFHSLFAFFRTDNIYTKINTD